MFITANEIRLMDGVNTMNWDENMTAIAITISHDNDPVIYDGFNGYQFDNSRLVIYKIEFIKKEYYDAYYGSRKTSTTKNILKTIYINDFIDFTPIIKES